MFIASSRLLSWGRTASLLSGVLTSLVLGSLKELGDHLKVLSALSPHRSFSRAGILHIYAIIEFSQFGML